MQKKCKRGLTLKGINNNVSEILVQTGFNEVFNIEKTDNKEEDCYNGILKLQEFFKDLGMPQNMADLGISKDELEDLSLRVSWNKTRVIEDVIPITYKEMREIYELMF